jgi:hypothetical protein
MPLTLDEMDEKNGPAGTLPLGTPPANQGIVRRKECRGENANAPRLPKNPRREVPDSRGEKLGKVIADNRLLTGSTRLGTMGVAKK